ncbi:MAG: DUF5050 domain-containing protein [Clostridia bacterium]|nr:DUF5050 domain-containing protein [Clostridia bacterium]
MKKRLTYILLSVLVLCLLAGCGGSGQAKKPGLTDGYWVVEKFVMEGTEFDKATMVDIFGDAENVFALVFSDSGSVDGVLFGETVKGTYSGADNALQIDFMGEKLSGSHKNGVLEIKLADDSSFTLKNQKEMPKSLLSNAWLTYKVNFDIEQTMAMGSFMNYGRYIVEDDVLYGLTHSDSLSGGLGATPISMKGDFPVMGETKILDDKPAACLAIDGDYLYYLRDYEAVCRVNKNGGDVKTLYKGNCDYLLIHEGRLYFTDEDYHLVSTDMDGKDLKTVVDKEIYYPYFICTNWMVFQDDADNESLHLYNITMGEEISITDAPSYCPILDGKYRISRSTKVNMRI